MLKLYNALTESVDAFTPLNDTVTIYVCGVTPYDTTHLGHAFTYVVFDVLIRYLEGRGTPVRYVQNVTDIDDDVLRKAKEKGMNWRDLGEQETEKFLEDLRALNIRMPDVYAKATEETAMMIEIINVLLAKDYAYERNGSVYFRVASDAEFGKLSRYDYATMLKIANERGNFPDDPNKQDPLDFVLWQAAQPGEPTWQSPWGEGRPGWHIECSAMSLRYLGEQIDIHGGGADLLFPHHECEIAQSENFTEKEPFVRVWMHTAMVRMDGEKMSKSLGNMVFVQKLRETYHADEIRAYLLSHHYRTAFEWNQAGMDDAAQRAKRWRDALAAPSGTGPSLGISYHTDAFHTYMQSDLDTPNALLTLDTIAANILLHAPKGFNMSEAQETLKTLGAMVGMTMQ
jgi:L-cysteine:1D-myo-inositol 2-amino-2-deoxy-alpha-D-glucopyranoside ligase